MKKREELILFSSFMIWGVDMEEMEIYAKENNIPIMQKDGISYLIDYIKDNNIKNILEIGSAIGYSSIMMASVSSDVKVTTIEKDTDRYNIAVSNINKHNLSNHTYLVDINVNFS